jgi:hypothetical protein
MNMSLAQRVCRGNDEIDPASTPDCKQKTRSLANHRVDAAEGIKGNTTIAEICPGLCVQWMDFDSKVIHPVDGVVYQGPQELLCGISLVLGQSYGHAKAETSLL